MRRLIPLLAVAAAAVASAMPAQSAILPHCTTRLVAAATGDQAACSTQGPAPLGNCCVSVRRTMRIEVANGAVNASLTCDGQPAQTAYVTAVLPAEINRNGGYSCSARIVAAVPDTSAVVTSTFSYVTQPVN
jgi:hypothetical protein